MPVGPTEEVPLDLRRAKGCDSSALLNETLLDVRKLYDEYGEDGLKDAGGFASQNMDDLFAEVR